MAISLSDRGQTSPTPPQQQRRDGVGFSSQVWSLCNTRLLRVENKAHITSNTTSVAETLLLHAPHCTNMCMKVFQPMLDALDRSYLVHAVTIAVIVTCMHGLVTLFVSLVAPLNGPSLAQVHLAHPTAPPALCQPI